MVDVVDKATRSRMMAGIRGKNTRPELVIRSALHKKGLRFRLHDALLPGRPDLVLKRHRAVVFINGCFWHGHGCTHFKWPKSNRTFWRQKINRNIRRDDLVGKALKNLGWRYFVVWECEIRRALRDQSLDVLAGRLTKKISGG